MRNGIIVMRRLLAFLPLLLSIDGARAASLTEPTLHLPPSGHLRVALTLDACTGKTDDRILNTLVEARIPATIFVTGRWLKRNAAAVEIMKAHPDLFLIENHGRNHVPAVDQPVAVFGIKAAGSPGAVETEVAGGAAAMATAGLPAPIWFRGATAKYTASSIDQIHRLGFSVAGYSVNGDGGSLLGAASAEKRVAGAQDGDVIIAHINQPTHAAGEGVAKGLMDLKARGAEFVTLGVLKGDGLPTPGS